MFKHYLTDQLTLSFDQACRMADLPHALRESLVSSSGKVSLHFARSLRESDPKERLKHLCVALMCLRDCQDVITQAQITAPEIRGRFEVLNGRLERLCLEASAAENGQLRLFG